MEFLSLGSGILILIALGSLSVIMISFALAMIKIFMFIVNRERVRINKKIENLVFAQGRIEERQIDSHFSFEMFKDDLEKDLKKSLREYYKDRLSEIFKNFKDKQAENSKRLDKLERDKTQNS